MQVRRLGYATLKGTRHLQRGSVTLAPHGPVGDRAFCLVDPDRRRVLRTVENPSLVLVEACDDGGDLSLRFPNGHVVSGRPSVASPHPLNADYWGRPASLRLLDGPHAAALAAYLGRPVRLAAVGPGEVVWGGVLSLVTTGALSRLRQRLRANGVEPPPELEERFRATMTLDAPDDPRPGSRLRVGTAVIEVGRPIDRCAVVDVGPSTGSRDASVLAQLDRHAGLLTFGLDARVVEPGVVHLADTADVAAIENPPD